jgi:hypothetical protein
MRSWGIAIFYTILSKNFATYQNPDLTLKRFEIRHDIHYLTRRRLKLRHRRMNSLKQRSLQVCNWISEAQCAKWGRIRKATPADFTDGVTLRAILADEYQTSPFRWRLSAKAASVTHSRNALQARSSHRGWTDRLFTIHVLSGSPTLHNLIFGAHRYATQTPGN